MKKLSFIIILLLSIDCSIFSNPALDKFLSSKCLKNASIGISIHNIDNNTTILDYQQNLALIPASTLKLISTATALSLNGPEYKYETQFGYKGLIENGVLKGDIIIKGSADPSLLSVHFYNNEEQLRSRLIAAMRKAGIKSVEGRVICDETILDNQGVNPAWPWEDMGNYYASGIYGINFMDNSYSVTFDTSKKGKKPEIISTNPEVTSLVLKNYLLPHAAKYDSAFIYGAPYINERYIFGAIPQNREKFSIQGDMPEPALQFADYINNVIKNAGISISGQPISARIAKEESIMVPGLESELFTWQSPELSELIRKCNFKSINLYAEAIIRLAAGKKNNITINESVEKTLNYWKSKGLDTSGLFIYDGSGLSPQNRVTASFLTQLLILMKDNEEFVNSLPRAGMEGTVKSFMSDSKHKGNIKAKSGTIRNVRAYSGYIYGKQNVAFTVLVNGYSCGPGDIRILRGKHLEDLEL